MRTNMKQLRVKKGLTQEELAQKVGVRRETILYLEQGKYNPSLKLAHQVAQELGQSIEKIFMFENKDFED